MKAATNPRSLDLLNLNITPAADGESVVLEQDFGGNLHSITLHASQVRAVIDLMEMAKPEIERLHRALLRSWDMAARLQHSLGVTSDFGREDLTLEVRLAIELVDFLAFICAEFDEQYGPLPCAFSPTPSPPAAPAARAQVPQPAIASKPLRDASSGELFQGATQ
ncbi:MAG: hypothetical protein EOO27_47420 [Comamonadaceae bacterium]|nr:MAG: hypothetical protein EOO27_47420 [Comamonadaceae bacterium]